MSQASRPALADSTDPDAPGSGRPARSAGTSDGPGAPAAAGPENDRVLCKEHAAAQRPGAARGPRSARAARARAGGGARVLARALARVVAA